MKYGIFWKSHLRRILFLGLIVAVCSGCAGSDSDDDNNIPAGNNLPIADAGPDQDVFINSLVILDGSGSNSPNNETLTYSWSIKSPEGSSAILSDPIIENPTFTPDVSGTYEISLIVNDGTYDSAQDTVKYEASPIFSNGFEEGLGDWSIEGKPTFITWEVGTPDYGPEGPYLGSSCAGTVLNGPYPTKLFPYQSWLISPSIALPEIEGVNQIYLTFFHWFEFATFSNGRVYMSMEITPYVWGEWELLKDATYTGVSTEWSKVIQGIEIFDYNPDKRIRFGFQLSGGLNLFRAGWYLDDVKVSF